MKKLSRILVFALALGSLFVFDACRKDPCKNIVCYNGGYCANGLCNCPTGYTGSDCFQQQTPTAMRITKIEVLNFPGTTGSGGGWDLTSGPDIYITVDQGTTSSGTFYDSGTFYQDASAGNVYTFTDGMPIVLNPATTNWSIGIWDYDTADPDDFMAGVYFKPSEEADGFPTNFQLTTSSMRVKLYVAWLF